MLIAVVFVDQSSYEYKLSIRRMSNPTLELYRQKKAEFSLMKPLSIFKVIGLSSNEQEDDLTESC